MKSRQFLREAINPKLLQYVSSTPGFSMPSTNLAVFAWDDKTLARLIKMGLNPGVELRTIRTPQKGQLGLGIVDLSNSLGAVGAIDTDGGVFIVSSLDDDATGSDARQFFRLIKNSQVRKIFSRLEELEELYKEKNKEKDEDDRGDIKEKILKANEDIYSPVDEDLLDFESDDPEEIKNEIEEKIEELNLKKPALEKKISYYQNLSKGLNDKEKIREIVKKYVPFTREIRSIDSNIEGLEELLSMDKLFKSSPKKSKDKDNKQIQKQIEQWLDTLNADFPGLDVEDAEQFMPQGDLSESLAEALV